MIKINNKKIQSFALLSIIYFPMVSAETKTTLSDYKLSIKFGGWSKHVDEKNVGGKEWNENHMGYGLKYTHDKNQDFSLTMEAWHMKDSYSDNSNYLGVGATYVLPIDSKEFGLSFTLTGGFLKRKLHFYDEIADEIYTEDETSMLPMYYATVELFEKAEIDFIYIPKGFGKVSNEVYFMRFGYKF
jgi:hypothetical protein